MPANTSERRVVLVVEDEPVQRLTLVDIVEDAGFDVEEAWDAESAIRILESRLDIRLVVTDVDMPGSMDGLKLAAAVRHRWPPIEIVVISAGQAPTTDELPSRAEFMPKPLNRANLTRAVQRLAA